MSTTRGQSRLFLCAVSLTLACAATLAHAERLAHPILGTVAFPNSCKPQVKAEFDRGVALLHSFWHDKAEQTFAEVAAADPGCAIAYWGEAMTHFHQFLDTPTAADLAAGQEELRKADAARESSTRESAYLHALHLFYDGLRESYTDADYHARATRYSDAMGALAAAYPDDLEAKVFYALSLLASDPPADSELVNPRKAFSILEPLFREHPDHPGIAHYIIHACDHPQMAREGLDAARRYSLIAPSAPHALHMPAHIFARLGLWQDDIRSNLASKAAADRNGLHVDAENRLHAMEFLEYAYLQTGRTEEARAIVGEAKDAKPSDVNPRYADFYPSVEARLPSLLAIESHDWTMAARLEPLKEATWYSEGLTLLAHAEAAGHRHDARAGGAAERTMDAVLSKHNLRWGAPQMTLPQEIHAWAAFSRGDGRTAVQLLRPIAEWQAKAGKGEVELPAREMLAEILLMSGDAAGALEAYEQSLASDPNRFNGLLGAAQAAAQLGRRDLALKYYRMLLSNCDRADGAQARLLTHARAVVGVDQ